ncbi:amidohydrolase [Silanimonas sp.]|jgi:imidazolonepropionase-like amidohydrolase|uniref:amidohydrolase n=1 Tax=Silanimonas sp. TaxID=1929290 RepID=UPI0022C07CF1|nr:amidohydrolase [Silanimonas sp.]MCZ8115398.1 amidohydrolase [Silanimonas sp.]
MRPLDLRTTALAAALALGLGATADARVTVLKDDPYPSTYERVAAPDTLIRNATVLVGDGTRLENADVLLRDGKVARVGQGLDAPNGATVVDGTGKWITPGLIDVHSHLGVYASPGLDAHSDGNEMTDPVTSQVWAEHAVWPQDPGFGTALAGGVTSMLILPGSGNLIGGRGVVLKNVPGETYQQMKFPGAPWSLKMACGENPKRFYGGRGSAPMTRMGNVAGYRNAFIEAREYLGKLDDDEPPTQDLQLETLAAAMNSEIQVQIHCYRADEMAIMLDLAEEFDFKVAAFHHGTEAYKIADRLAEAGTCGALWADWWGFKAEAYDAVQENILIVDRANEGKGCAVVHSDSAEGIQRLNQEAGKVIGVGRRAGIDIAPEHAVRWITQNAAQALGIQEQAGTLERGKMGDVVLWNQNPFSVYAKAEKVWIDGALMFDRNDPALQPVSDFTLGQEPL